MKTTKNPELNREENHFVKATLVLNGSEIKDVPCKIYLPERTHEKPHVVLKPSKEDTLKIMRSHKGALKATGYGPDKKIKAVFEAPEVYFSESFTKYRGTDFSEPTVLCEPQDLHVMHYHGSHNNQEKTQIAFWISANRCLTPPMGCFYSYTGGVNYEREPKQFTIKNQVNLSFDKSFGHKTASNGDLVQWSYLVANTEQQVSADDVGALKEILHELDDFLLVASFAARRRTVCLGWGCVDNNSQSTYYRGSYAFPDVNDEESPFAGVIDLQYFQGYMEACYPEFLRFENKLALRDALCAATPYLTHTLEASFLRMFAGLETLILDFRRRANLEFILPKPKPGEKDKWNTLKKYLKTCINESTEPELTPEQNKSICRKLNELNRVSLSEAFTMFCKEYEISLEDLWPVFKNKESIGLCDIRNKLIHGDPIPHDLLGAVVVAKEHLKFTLERALVRVLGWDVEKTQVSPAALKHYHAWMKDTASEQARLVEYIK